ncbi:MAG: type I phosphomannose isomerase catalytic subunit [Luteolibacter sp.]
MNESQLYPLRFKPIYQYRPWGGRRLGNWLTAPLPGNGAIGEAWVLSDREEHSSVVANGPLKGHTITQLMTESAVGMLGEMGSQATRFPLLLKFLDARDSLSVQVHPTDQQTNELPPGESGKTEAWVVLEAGERSRIYAGLKTPTSADELRRAIEAGSLPDLLAAFTPREGDSILLEAGTVHSLADTVVFEVQQNSDVTFRLYDWDRIDPATGQPRALEIEKAIDCIDFKKGPTSLAVTIMETLEPVMRERLLGCEHFEMWRIRGESRFPVGEAGVPRALVCIGGDGYFEHHGVNHAVTRGDVFLIPAAVGECICQPRGQISLLEISLPEGHR